VQVIKEMSGMPGGPVLKEYATAHINFLSEKLQATEFKSHPIFDFKKGLSQVVKAYLQL